MFRLFICGSRFTTRENLTRGAPKSLLEAHFACPHGAPRAPRRRYLKIPEAHIGGIQYAPQVFTRGAYWRHPMCASSILKKKSNFFLNLYFCKFVLKKIQFFFWNCDFEFLEHFLSYLNRYFELFWLFYCGQTCHLVNFPLGHPPSKCSIDCSYQEGS